MENLHWILDPIKYQYTDFAGRASRQQYWMFVLWYLILYIGISVVGGLVGFEQLGLLFSLVVWIPSIAISTRRLHDIDMSGWWQLLFLLPILGFFILLYFYVKPGQVGGNRFGVDPKAHTGAAEPVPQAAVTNSAHTDTPAS